MLAAGYRVAGIENLERLSIHDSQFTDLTPLAKLTNLKILNLRDCRVTDPTPLAKLTELEWLDLSGTQVTDAQIKQLQQALPNCQIHSGRLQGS